MCNMKYCMIQVIIGVTGIVTKRLEKYLERIPEKHSVDSLRRDIAHNKENATIWNLKPEWWDAPLVEEDKYQWNGNCDNMMMMMMMMMMMINQQ